MRTQISDLLVTVHDWSHAKRSFASACQATTEALTADWGSSDRPPDAVGSYVATLITARKVSWAARLHGMEDPHSRAFQAEVNALTAAADRAFDFLDEIVRGTWSSHRERIETAQAFWTMTTATAREAAVVRAARDRMWQAMTPAYLSLIDEPDQQRIFDGAYQSLTTALETFSTNRTEERRDYEEAVATLTPRIQWFAHRDVVEDVHLSRAVNASENDSAARAWRRIDGLLIDTHHALARTMATARRHATAHGVRTAELLSAAEAFAATIDGAGLAYPGTGR